MKKIITFLITLSLISCVDNDKEVIADFLKNSLKSANTIEIIEISKADSLYSPYNELMSLDLLCAFTSTSMVKYSSKAWEVQSKKESIAYLDSAITLYQTERQKIDSVLFQSNSALSSPLYIKGKDNRKAVKVKYKVDGNICNDTFFFNKGSSSIGHRHSDIQLIINKLKLDILEIDKEFREAEKDKKEMKNGNAYSYAW